MKWVCVWVYEMCVYESVCECVLVYEMCVYECMWVCVSVWVYEMCVYECMFEDSWDLSVCGREMNTAEKRVTDHLEFLRKLQGIGLNE